MMGGQLMKEATKDITGHLGAAFDGVVTVHQHLWFDDGDKTDLLSIAA